MKNFRKRFHFFPIMERNKYALSPIYFYLLVLFGIRWLGGWFGLSMTLGLLRASFTVSNVLSTITKRRPRYKLKERNPIIPSVSWILQNIHFKINTYWKPPWRKWKWLIINNYKTLVIILRNSQDLYCSMLTITCCQNISSFVGISTYLKLYVGISIWLRHILIKL